MPVTSYWTRYRRCVTPGLSSRRASSSSMWSGPSESNRRRPPPSRTGTRWISISSSSPARFRPPGGRPLRSWVGDARPRAYRRDMRHGAVFVPLAAAALLVTACTSSSQPSGRSQPPAARASAAQAATAHAGVVTSNGCAGQPPVSPLPVWARSGFHPANLAMPHVIGEAGNIVAILWAPRRPALRRRCKEQEQQDPLGAQDSTHRIESAGHQGHARGQHAHGDRVRAGRAGTVDHQPARARLLDTPPELVRPDRRTQAPLRGLTGSRAEDTQVQSGPPRPRGRCSRAFFMTDQRLPS